MAKDKETPTGGAWHRDPAVEKTCPIGSCRRDGGEFRASQRLATGTRGSGQSYGPCARNGSRRETPTGEKEQQGRGGGRLIQEGNRAHVSKATHRQRERERERELLFKRETAHLCLKVVYSSIIITVEGSARDLSRASGDRERE